MSPTTATSARSAGQPYRAARKIFQIREGVFFSFRAEFFNLFNMEESLANPSTGSPQNPATRSNGVLTGGFGYLNYTGIAGNRRQFLVADPPHRVRWWRASQSQGVPGAPWSWTRGRAHRKDLAAAPHRVDAAVRRRCRSRHNAGAIDPLRGNSRKIRPVIRVAQLGIGPVSPDRADGGRCGRVRFQQRRLYRHLFHQRRGDPDLRKTGPEFHNRLYRNNCDLTFTDVTAAAGMAGEGYSMGVATADFDNDGLADIFVAGVNATRSIAISGTAASPTSRIAPGSRLSTRSTASGGPSPPAGSTTTTMAGSICSWSTTWRGTRSPRPCSPPENRFYCHPNAYRGLPNQLFHNNRDGTFTDVSAESGIARHIGKGMGVTFADFDRDGYTDVFVANDSVRSFLFRNQGDGTFREIGLEAGVALREDGAAIAGMGADFRDFDNDGWPDLIVSGMVNDSFQLFRNLGGAPCSRIWDSAPACDGHAPADGLEPGDVRLRQRRLEGSVLRALALSAVGEIPWARRRAAEQSSAISEARFEDVSAGAGPSFRCRHHHGAAFADFDNDGRVDVVVSVAERAGATLSTTSPNRAHWVAFRLRGKRSNRDGLGAVLKATLPDGRVLYNHAQTSVGYRLFERAAGSLRAGREYGGAPGGAPLAGRRAAGIAQPAR